MRRKRMILATEAQLNRLAKTAKNYGVTVELVQENGTVIRIVPIDVDAPPVHEYLDEDPPRPPIFPDLDARERAIIETLERVGIDVPMAASAIRFAGPHNVGRLVKRGYVRYMTPEGTPHKAAEIALTKKAVEDKEANKAYYKKWPFL